VNKRPPNKKLSSSENARLLRINLPLSLNDRCRWRGSQMGAGEGGRESRGRWRGALLTEPQPHPERSDWEGGVIEARRRTEIANPAGA